MQITWKYTNPGNVYTFGDMPAKFAIYLDTSVINFIFADDAPEKREITIDFFDNFVKLGIYDTYISEYVIAEIMQHPNPEKRDELLKVIDDYNIELIMNDEAENVTALAEEYINRGVIPAKKKADAFHIALSVLSGMNYLVSWNFKHLANVNKERQVKIINIENGYSSDFRIITPLELIDYGS